MPIFTYQGNFLFLLQVNEVDTNGNVYLSIVEIQRAVGKVKMSPDKFKVSRRIYVCLVIRHFTSLSQSPLFY